VTLYPQIPLGEGGEGVNYHACTPWPRAISRLGRGMYI